MEFLYFLIVLFIFLLLYTIISTLIKMSMYLTTNYRFEDYRLLFPTLFTMISWAATIFGCIYVIIKVFHIDLMDLFLRLIINVEVDPMYWKEIIICLIASFVIGLIIQSLSFFAINIDIKKIGSKIRYKIKRLFIKDKKDTNDKNELKDNKQTENSFKLELISEDNPQQSSPESFMTIDKPIEKLSFSSAFIASLFTICLLLFIICISFLSGYILSAEILERI